MRSVNKGPGFPLSIFLILYIIMVWLSIAISLGYFYVEGKRSVSNIIEYTREYSLPLSEAITGIAGLCYEKKDYSALRELLKSGTIKKNIHEAFFVLADGTIIAHSDIERVRELKGNIANDEFAYNIDQIFLPLKSKSEKAQFFDYNINDKNIPFHSDVIRLLKRYFHDKFDVDGWLVTRAVYSRGEGIGCVGMLMGKERIYNTIKDQLNNTYYLAGILFFFSVIISFFISILVNMRYRGIIKDLKEQDGVMYGIQSDNIIKDAIRIKESDSPHKDKHELSWEMTVPVIEDIENDAVRDKKTIKDAIPVTR